MARRRRPAWAARWRRDAASAGATSRRRARPALLVLTLSVGLILTAGCGRGDGFSPGQWDGPGENERAGDILIRYAHIAEPVEGTHEAGTDVRSYVWLFNQGTTDDRLVEARTPAASRVTLVVPGRPSRGLPLVLPAGGSLVPEPEGPYLLLHDLRAELRGGDFVPVELRFADAGRVRLQVQVQPPPYDPSAWPTMPDG